MSKFLGVKFATLFNAMILSLKNRGIIETARKIFEYILKLLPLKNIIVFRGQNEFDGNARALFEYMVRNKLNEKYKMYWLVSDVSLYKNKEYKQD